MCARRRDVLRAGAMATAVGLAGCGTNFTERPQLLVVRNETDTERTVTVTILEAAETTTRSQSTDGTTPRGTKTGTPGTTRIPATESDRWVVDFERTVAASDRVELVEVLPASGSFDVVADVHDGPTGTGSYVDEESVRITIQSDDVTVETYLAEGGVG